MKQINIPQGRHCVKQKRVFIWMRDGTARAWLVVCGYIQVAGVGFKKISAQLQMTYHLVSC